MEQPKSDIIEYNGKLWYLPSKGKNYWHRLDGPAREWSNGTKMWWVDNKLHRLDGPAIEWSDGTKVWFINGEFLTIQSCCSTEIEDWLKGNKINLTIEEDQMAFKLRWM